MRTLSIAIVAVLCGCASAGEETPPSITYPNSRQSTEGLEVNRVSYVVDRGIEWQGIKLYLSLTSDLIAVESKSAKVLWHQNVSPFWRRMTIKEIETAPGTKAWVVELGAHKEDDPGQQQAEYRDLKTGAKIDRPAPKPAGVVLMPVRT